MHQFSEHHINCLSINRPGLPSKISPRLFVVVVLVRLEIPHLLRDNLSYSFTQLLVFLNTFILVNSAHELARLVTGFPVRDFLKPCSVGRPLLKVLMATSSKSPSYLIVHLLVSV